MRLHELYEALVPSQYRNLVKGWDKQKYRDIFTDSRYTHDRNGYRVYIPIQTDQPMRQQKSTTQQQIEQELAKHGFEMVDYRKGIVRNTEKNQNIKIGKVLNKLNMQALLNAFNTDKSREATKSEYMAVISRHPYDIAGMSTDRGWTSCMNLQSGSYNRYVPIDIREGSVIAYVTRIDDLDIKNPVGRVLLKPFVDVLGKPVIYFGIEDKVYGTNVPGFVDAVKSWVNRVNQEHELDQVVILKVNPNLYDDSGILKRQRIIGGKNITYQEKELFSKIIDNPRVLLDVENITDQMVLAMFSSPPFGMAVRTLKKLVKVEKKYKLSQNLIDRIATILSNYDFDIIINLLDEIDFVPSEDSFYQIFYDMNDREIRYNFNKLYEISKQNSNIKITDRLLELIVSKKPESLFLDNYFQENPNSMNLKILKTALREKGEWIKPLSNPDNHFFNPKLAELYEQNWEELGLIALSHSSDSIVKTLVKKYKEHKKPITSEFIDAALNNASQEQVDDIVEAMEALPQELQVRFTESQIVKILVKGQALLGANVMSLNSMGYDLNFSIQQQVIKQSNNLMLMNALYRKNLPINQQLADWALRNLDARAIKYISNPDRDQLKTAVMRNSNALLYFDEMDIKVDPELIDLSLELYPDSLKYISKPTKEQIIKAVHMTKPKKTTDPYEEIDEYSAETLFEALSAADLSQQEENQLIDLALRNREHRLYQFIRYDYYNIDWLTPELQIKMLSSGNKVITSRNLSAILDALKYHDKPINKEMIMTAIDNLDEIDLGSLLDDFGDNLNQLSESDILKMATKTSSRGLWGSVWTLTRKNMMTDNIAQYMIKNHQNITSHILDALSSFKYAPTVDWKIIRYGIIKSIEEESPFEVVYDSLKSLFGHRINCWGRYKNDVNAKDVITIIEKSLENSTNLGEKIVLNLIIMMSQTLEYSPGKIDSLVNQELLEKINKIYPGGISMFDRYRELFNNLL